MRKFPINQRLQPSANFPKVYVPKVERPSAIVSLKMEEKGIINIPDASPFPLIRAEVRPRWFRPTVFVFFFLAGLCFASWASRIPDIKIKLHLSEAQLGSILLALPAGSWTALPFSGRLVTRFGSKTMVRIAILLYSIALVHIGLVKSGWHLAGALYFFGFCGNMVNISINTQGVMTET